MQLARYLISSVWIYMARTWLLGSVITSLVTRLLNPLAIETHVTTLEQLPIKFNHKLSVVKIYH